MGNLFKYIPCSGFEFTAFVMYILLLPCVMVYYIFSALFLMFFWCPCMAINVNLQYNGGFLPDNILLTHPGSSEVPRNPLTRWDVSSTPANGIFLTKKQKNKKTKMPNGWRTIKSLVHKIQLHG